MRVYEMKKKKLDQAFFEMRQGRERGNEQTHNIYKMVKFLFFSIKKEVRGSGEHFLT